VYLGDADVEDIVTVVAGRAELTREAAAAPATLRDWLAVRTTAFLQRGEAMDVIAGALPDAWAAPDVAAAVRRRFESIARSAP
jgi:hypothetical protein